MSDIDKNIFYKFSDSVVSLVDTPVTWFRENVVASNRPTYYWYHRKYRRVPTIDECYTDDIVCYTEANEQYKRDRIVDGDIIKILRNRVEECNYRESPDEKVKCKEIRDQFLLAAEHHFTKYGDLGAQHDVRDCYMKQKHRMIWERRHGPVGSGMRPREEWGK